MNAFLASSGLVVLAEMGDKTQLLAMAFACRFGWQIVMLGVFAATLCNHFLAVVAGTYLTKVIPLYYAPLAASASFVLFGFWTLRGDTLEGEDKRFNYSPFWTVAIAFFLAEMGDQTQLATVALAGGIQIDYSGLARNHNGHADCRCHRHWGRDCSGEKDPATAHQMGGSPHLYLFRPIRASWTAPRQLFISNLRSMRFPSSRISAS